MKTFICSLLLLVSLSLSAQPNTHGFKAVGKPATVKNWGSLSMFIMANFFDETKAEIIKQIGQQEFDEMKKHGSEDGWPSAIAEAEEERNELKMYQIAAYTHKFNGKTFNPMVILRVPYSENQDWRADVKWEGNLYFILQAKDVSLIKK